MTFSKWLKERLYALCKGESGSKVATPDSPPPTRISVDSYGWIELVSVSGSDAYIGETAVRSRAKTAPSNLEGLIRTLIRKHHTSPVEFVEFTFDIYAPITVAREWVRHRTASWSEMSGRMTRLQPHTLTPTEWRAPSSINKQSSIGTIRPQTAAQASKLTENAYQQAFDTYERLLDLGISYEQARNVLPVGGYTCWRWKIDLHNLLHFLKLRLAPDTMYEFRVYAEAVASVVRGHVPITWRAFEDYELTSYTISGPLLEWLRAYLHDEATLPYVRASTSEWREFAKAFGFDAQLLIESINGQTRLANGLQPHKSTHIRKESK